MSDDYCFHLQTFCGSLAPAAGFSRDFYSRGSHWVAHVRTCACVSFSWYRHRQLVFSGGLAPLAAQRVDGTGTEQQGGPPLGRAMAWRSTSEEEDSEYFSNYLWLFRTRMPMLRRQVSAYRAARLYLETSARTTGPIASKQKLRYSYV